MIDASKFCMQWPADLEWFHCVVCVQDHFARAQPWRGEGLKMVSQQMRVQRLCCWPALHDVVRESACQRVDNIWLGLKLQGNDPRSIGNRLFRIDFGKEAPKTVFSVSLPCEPELLAGVEEGRSSAGPVAARWCLGGGLACLRSDVHAAYKHLQAFACAIMRRSEVLESPVNDRPRFHLADAVEAWLARVGREQAEVQVLNISDLRCQI